MTFESPKIIPGTALFIDLKRRLLEKTTIRNDDCWYCNAGGPNHKYGTISFKGSALSNHIASYLIHCGEIPKGICVLHTCDYKRCINPDHLWLGTQQDNINDMFSKGRQGICLGENRWNTSLTENDVKSIRKLVDEGYYSKTEIGDMFGVSQSTVNNIKNRKRWGHVP